MGILNRKPYKSFLRTPNGNHKMIRRFDNVRPRYQSEPPSATQGPVLLTLALLLVGWFLTMSPASSRSPVSVVSLPFDLLLTPVGVLALIVTSIVLIATKPWQKALVAPPTIPAPLSSSTRSVEITPSELQSLLPKRESFLEPISPRKWTTSSGLPTTHPSFESPAIPRSSPPPTHPSATTTWVPALESFIVAQVIVPLLNQLKLSDAQFSASFKISGFVFSPEGAVDNRPARIYDSNPVITLAHTYLPSSIASNPGAEAQWRRRLEMERRYFQVPGVSRSDTIKVLKSWSDSARIVGSRRVMEEHEELKILEAVLIGWLDEVSVGQFSGNYIRAHERGSFTGGHAAVWLDRKEGTEFSLGSFGRQLSLGSTANKLEKFLVTVSVLLFEIKSVNYAWTALGVPNALKEVVAAWK